LSWSSKPDYLYIERKNMAAEETVDVPSVVTHKRNRKRTKDIVRKLREQVW